MTVLRELSRDRLDLMGVQEVRWEYTFFFFFEMGMRTMNWVQGFLSMRESYQQLRELFVSDRMPYIILRGHWFHIIVLNVHAPTEDKIDDAKHNSK
jgi:hypothetical protein